LPPKYSPPRPITPPLRSSKEIALTNAINQLSVSPKKPKAKKQKMTDINCPSIFAPIFQVSKAETLGPKALQYFGKEERKHVSYFIFLLSWFMLMPFQKRDDDKYQAAQMETTIEKKLVISTTPQGGGGTWKRDQPSQFFFSWIWLTPSPPPPTKYSMFSEFQFFF